MFNRFSCLNDFVGYGPKHPRFVFFGIEEYDEGSDLSFETRCSRFDKPLFDKDQACRVLASAFHENGLIGRAKRYESSMEPGFVPVWNFCAMIAAAVRTPDNWVTEWPAEYQALGSKGGDTLLSWLFPIPKPGTKHWPAEYQEWFGPASCSRYYTSVWPLRRRQSASQRKELLQTVILDELPPDSMILCFGRSFWNRFSDLLKIVPGDWNPIIPGRAERAMTPKGLRVVRTGFPFGRPSGSPVTEEHVPLIAEALSS